jgi:hypothetical protein
LASDSDANLSLINNGRDGLLILRHDSGTVSEMEKSTEPVWTFGRSHGPLRWRDVLPDSEGVATVQYGDWPRRRQSWFIESLRDTPKYVVATRVEPDIEGRLIAVELRIFPAAWLDEDPEPEIGTWGMFESAPHDVEGLTTTKVRRASVATARKDARAIIKTFADRYPGTSPMRGLTEMGWDAPVRAAAAIDNLTRRLGRAGRPDSAYLPIAVRYVQLLHEGDTKPIKTLAKELGLRPEQVRDLVRRCRDRGLLTKIPRHPTSRRGAGVAGGELTDKALRLIEEGEDDGEH